MSRRNKKNNRPPIYLLSIVVTATVGVFAYFNVLISAVDSKDNNSVQFIIPKGSGVNTIASELESQNLIKSTFAFKVIVVTEGLVDQIQAGNYLLSPSQSTKEIAEMLTYGTLDSWVTIPEGYRNEQIAQTLEYELGINPTEFLLFATGIQGKLFPDTYLIPDKASSNQIINIMLTNYTTKTSKLRNLITASGLTEDEIIILASIIERETLSDSEKPLVSGILQKRITNDWPLQVDATLQYIKGNSNEWWPTPLPGDKEIASLYNTYLNLGLPPAPIANPGLASITAVLQPTPSEFWFYLHDQDGHIHYANTDQEHSDNVTRYLK